MAPNLWTARRRQASQRRSNTVPKRETGCSPNGEPFAASTPPARRRSRLGQGCTPALATDRIFPQNLLADIVRLDCRHSTAARRGNCAPHQGIILSVEMVPSLLLTWLGRQSAPLALKERLHGRHDFRVVKPLDGPEASHITADSDNRAIAAASQQPFDQQSNSTLSRLTSGSPTERKMSFMVSREIKTEPHSCLIAFRTLKRAALIHFVVW